MNRYPTPALQSHALHQGPAGLLKRYFPVEAGGFFRALASSSLTLSVETESEFPEAVFVLHTDIGTAGEWYETGLEKNGKVFTLDLPLTSAGTFGFKLKYSLDGGESWYWDRVPYTKIVVDPADTDDLRLYTLIPSVSGHM